MLIAHLTDLHVTEKNDGRGINLFAQRAIASVAALQPAPDCLLITGDLVESGSLAEYALLKAMLANLAMPIYLILGNHDNRANFRATFPNWPGVSQFSGLMNYLIDRWPVQIIALDTLNEGKASGRLDAASLDWLEATLKLAPIKPTIIIMHHPPFAIGLVGLDKIRLNEGAERLHKIVNANAQIERILCGHVHRMVYVRFAGTIASCMPSTGLQSRLSFDAAAQAAMIAEPPCMQLHLSAKGHELVTHLALIDDFSKTALE